LPHPDQRRGAHRRSAPLERYASSAAWARTPLGSSARPGAGARHTEAGQEREPEVLPKLDR
jgi:hypothetical protein